MNMHLFWQKEREKSSEFTLIPQISIDFTFKVCPVDDDIVERYLNSETVIGAVDLSPNRPN